MCPPDQPNLKPQNPPSTYPHSQISNPQISNPPQNDALRLRRREPMCPPQSLPHINPPRYNPLNTRAPPQEKENSVLSPQHSVLSSLLPLSLPRMRHPHPST